MDAGSNVPFVLPSACRNEPKPSEDKKSESVGAESNSPTQRRASGRFSFEEKPVHSSSRMSE